MKLNEKISTNIAKSLLKIEAVKLNISNPFTWVSGIKSPIYCDNRRILSYPETRSLVIESMASLINDQYDSIDCIAGVATGGIAHGVMVADSLNLPFVYVRSNTKGHGLGNKIEGVTKPGDKVLVIEDLISTGSSSLSAVESLRANNCNVIGMLAIFTYNFDIADKNFEKAKCKLLTLTNYNKLVDIASEHGYIKKEDMFVLEQWRKNPNDWK